MHRVLKQALKKALQWRELVHNPADAVKPPKVDRKPMATYDLEQTAALMERLRPTRMFIPALLGVSLGVCPLVLVGVLLSIRAAWPARATPGSLVEGTP